MRTGPLAASLLAFGLTCFPGAATAETTAIVGATVLPSPSDRPIPNGVVLLADGKITAVGTADEVQIPPSARRVDGTGLTLSAGFWNCHVHFSGPEWANAAKLPRETLNETMVQMLTAHGFTSVLDAGSTPSNTGALRERVQRGDVLGPRILTAGGPLFPKDALPIYLRQTLSPEVLAHLDQPSTPAEAVEDVKRNLAMGADATKLFTGTWLGGGKTGHMPLEIVRAAVDATHQAHKPALAHPQSIEGVKTALAGGVDVLMHTTAGDGPWPDELVSQLVAAHTALVPTLGLWTVVGTEAHMKTAMREAFVQSGVTQLRAFAKAHGEVLFGTDVGFHHVTNPEEELIRMTQAGMSWRDILASLTTAPAHRFGGGGSGTIAVGEPADLVLFKGDPVRSPRAFSHVILTLRAGQVLYTHPK